MLWFYFRNLKRSFEPLFSVSPRCPTLISLKNSPPTRNLEGRCLQRLEAFETPLGVASDSPPAQSSQRRFFSRIEVRLLTAPPPLYKHRHRSPVSLRSRKRPSTTR